MQTIEAGLNRFLVANGLFPEHAQAVIAEVKALPGSAGLKFSDPEAAYPLTMIAVLQMSARRAAIAWMERERPNHFALTHLRLDV